MADLPEVGPWVKEKLDALARYLDFYTKVLKNQPWRTIYLDAYAGGGRAVVRTEERATHGGPDLFGQEPPIDTEARELIDGSPRVALRIPNAFNRYIFVDPDANRAAELEALKAEFAGTRTINVLQATAAEGIAWVTAQPISRRTHRGIAFLDPFGAKLDWASIQRLADTGLFEVVVNFALSMAIQRMLPNSGEVPESWAATLDSYFGSRAWFDEVYQRRQGGLFAVNGLEKRPDYSERLLELYRTRLQSAFGHVSTPRLIRNTRGAPLYYLLWAGPNKKGLEGADYILTMGERLNRRQRERAAK
ncbi:three-Cys-motif partner protein TcmP [Xanthobacter sp. YC-JY1]|uniref:three-Cys-motif partner protein TcmP n=1 Tax=Xanthobacter TaxID=279 RepID=UPI001F39760F|nr:three-Cys-motif partner protein TcmP [Xanthobacter sp. YC-JY1]